jgi:DNA-binding CsgD family transcriptional regulator
MEGKNLEHIIENRKLPGLLLFDSSTGSILFRNPHVDSFVLDEKEHLEGIVEQFNNDLSASPSKKQPEEQVEIDPSVDNVVKTVICSEKRCYGILAFTLADESQDQNSAVVAILVEEISEEISIERLDLRKLSDSFHLSPRETQVIKELQLGRTDKMIAANLKISPETVHGYVKSIRGKLGVSTRTAIVHKLFSL